jgi:hypothetical protein
MITEEEACSKVVGDRSSLCRCCDLSTLLLRSQIYYSHDPMPTNADMLYSHTKGILVFPEVCNILRPSVY